MRTEIEQKIWESHRWDDISYHGSPTYQCELCHVYEYEDGANKFCPKLAEKAQQQEKAERAEFDRYIREQERIEYLKDKYGRK